MRTQRVVSKLDLAVIVAAIAGGALWIEHGHRIDHRSAGSRRIRRAAPAAACPDNDNVPYSAGCIAFLGSGYASGMRWQAIAPRACRDARAPARMSGHNEARKHETPGRVRWWRVACFARAPLDR